MSQYCVQHMWNTITQGPCCQCMTSQEKLAYVWGQMRHSGPDEETMIQCPYCLSAIKIGDKPCCHTLSRAVAAILQREDVMRCVMEQANRN
jgi:hypothetical protein